MKREPGVPESSAPDLEQLMIAYQQGDATAAKSLVDLLGRRLYAFFASQMGDRADADDMTQEAWLRIHRVRHTYRPGEPVLPWVYAIARRVRIDGYRRRRRAAARECDVDSLPALPAAANPRSESPSFAELVAPLPESQREALTMLKVDGLSIEEVARATCSTEGAVKQKVHRAYTRLRALLQPPASARVDGGKIP